MTIQPKLMRRLRDAYRVMRGKPPKQLQSIVAATPQDRVQDGLPLTDQDLTFLKDRLKSISQKAKLVLVGNVETKITVCCAFLSNAVSTTLLLSADTQVLDRFTSAVAETLPQRWDVVITNDVSSELSRMRKDPPEIIIINARLSDIQLRDILRVANEIGVSKVIGWGNEISTFPIMQLVHEYQTSEGGDYLWEAKVSENKRFDKGKPSLKMRNTQNNHDSTSCVSIIIPVYNALAYLPQTLNDIEKQTYTNWEVILVDDGSNESSDAVVNQFKQCWPNKRVIFEKKSYNEGVSIARNTGMALASGKFIAFLDADDRWMPTHLSSKIEFITTVNADLVYSTVEMFDDKTDKPLYNWGPTVDELEYFPDSLLSRNFIQPSGVVMKRKLYEAIGGFSQELSIGEDFDYWLRALKNGNVLAYDPIITTRYRKNHISAATTNRMVLCYDNIARIASRYGDLVRDDKLRKFLVVRHLMTAGLGHMSYSSSENFGCSMTAGRDLISLASRIDPSQNDVRYWLNVVNFAINTKASRFLKPIFRKQFNYYCRQPVTFQEFTKSA